MQITVHDALRARSAIEEKLKAYDLKPAVALDVDSKSVQNSVRDVLIASADGIYAKFVAYSTLSLLLADLRKAIAVYNVEHGVDANLADQAHCDRKLQKLKALLGTERVDLDSIENKVARRLESLKAPQQQPIYGARSTGDGDKLTVNPLTTGVAEALEISRRDTQRQKRKLEAERLSLVHGGKITIGEDDYNLLVEQGII